MTKKRSELQMDKFDCAFCGAPMLIAQECQNGYYFAECLNIDCGIATPYKDTYEEIIKIITRRISMKERTDSEE